MELESFVFAAPPNTATHTSRTGAWNSDAEMLDATRQVAAYGKPPVGGVGAGAGAQADLRNGRAKNLRTEAHPQQRNPNIQTKNLLSKATAMPLDQFKARQEQRHKEWREAHAREREKKQNGQQPPPPPGAVTDAD